MPPFTNPHRLGLACWRTPFSALIVLLAALPSTLQAEDLGYILISANGNAKTYYSNHSQDIANLGLHSSFASIQNLSPGFIATACNDNAWSANGLTLACAFTGMGTVPGTTDSTITGISSVNTATGGFTVVGYGQLPNYNDVAVAGYWIVGAEGGEFAFGTGVRYRGSLSPVTGLPPGTTSSALLGVTADGSIAVGGYWTVTDTELPFAFGDARYHGSYSGVTDPSAAFQSLPLIPGVFSGVVNAITPDGSVVLGSNADPFSGNPLSGSCTLYINGTNGYTPQNIGKVPGSIYTTPEAISSDGSAIAGYFYTDTSGNTYSFRWTLATGFVDLGVGAAPGPNGVSTFGEAFGITGDGSHVIGYGPDGGLLGYNWTQSGGLTLLYGLTDLIYFIPQCVSSDGVLTGGGSYGASFTSATATITTSGGQTYNLQNLAAALNVDLTGWVLNQVTTVVPNSDGTYLLAGNGNHNGLNEAWVLQLGALPTAPTPTPSPTPSPTPTPTPTLTPTRAPTPTPRPSPTPKPSPTLVPTPTAGITPTPSPTPTPTPTRVPTPTPRPSPTPVPSPTPGITPTPSPTHTPTPTRVPTPTPRPTPTPKPSPTLSPTPT